MKKRVASLVIASAMVASMLCTVSVHAEGLKIGYTCMDGTNPFFVTIEAKVKELVEANGDELISVDPANDVTLQITQVEDLIVQGIDAMLMNPAEAEGILPALDMLKADDIPIIGFDTEVADMSYLVSYAGSDNYNAGYVCGEDLVAKLPDGGKLIVLASPTMNSVTDRVNGFLDAIEGHGFEIVAQQDAKGNLEVSMGITEDLLRLTKLDSGVLEEAVVVDVLPVLEQVMRMMSLVAQEKNVDLTFSAMDGCLVWATRDEVHQVIYNLTDNALKYSAGGPIQLSLRKSSEQVVLAVADRGPGIPEADLPRIFERFYRVDKARSRDAGGTGLGLSIVSDTVKRRNGTVEVANRPDGGAVFTVRWPLAEGGEGT